MNSKILLQSRRSFSMLFFFFFLVSSSLRKGLAFPTNLRAEDCEPKSCGNGLNIRYPFWLHDRHPSYCGYPSFKVTCRGSDPVLNLLDHEYLIQQIFYEGRTVLVSQANPPDSGCSFRSYNLTLGQTLFRVNSTNRCLLFFFNCSTKLTQFKELRCSDDPTPAYFAGDYSTADRPKFNNGSCESVVVPTFRDPAIDGDDYAALLKHGFLLDWNATDCGECRRSGGQCGYDDDWKSFMCICPDGPHRGYCRESSPHLNERISYRDRGKIDVSLHLHNSLVLTRVFHLFSVDHIFRCEIEHFEA